MNRTFVREGGKTVYFALIDSSGDPVTGYTFELGDVKFSKDGAAFVDVPLVQLAEVGHGWYSATFGSGDGSDTDAAQVLVSIKDLTDPAAWQPDRILLESYGATDAEHQFVAVGATIVFGELIVSDGLDLGGASNRLTIPITDLHGSTVTTDEITPGTITIERRAEGAGAWVNPPVVDGVAMTEEANAVYHDLDLSLAALQAGDRLRITIAGVSVTRDGETWTLPTLERYARIAGGGTSVVDLSTVALDAVQSRVDASLGAYDSPTNTELDTAIASVIAAIGGLNDVTANEVRDAILAGIVEGTLTVQSIFRILAAAAAGQVQITDNGDGTKAISIKSPVTPATERISSTVNASGERTATTVSGA